MPKLYHRKTVWETFCIPVSMNITRSSSSVFNIVNNVIALCRFPSSPDAWTKKDYDSRRQSWYRKIKWPKINYKFECDELACLTSLLRFSFSDFLSVTAFRELSSRSLLNSDEDNIFWSPDDHLSRRSIEYILYIYNITSSNRLFSRMIFTTISTERIFSCLRR